MLYISFVASLTIFDMCMRVASLLALTIATWKAGSFELYHCMTVWHGPDVSAVPKNKDQKS